METAIVELHFDHEFVRSLERIDVGGANVEADERLTGHVDRGESQRAVGMAMRFGFTVLDHPMVVRDNQVAVDGEFPVELFADGRIGIVCGLHLFQYNLVETDELAAFLPGLDPDRLSGIDMDLPEIDLRERSVVAAMAVGVFVECSHGDQLAAHENFQL